MSATIIALAGYIAWTTLLLLVLIGYRSVAVAKGEKAANEFKASGDDVSDLGQRITRAQANCVESFPIIGGTLLLALAIGHSEITDGLALIVLGARVAQSVVHILSTAVIAVQVRLLCFLVQLGVCGYWLFQIAM